MVIDGVFKTLPEQVEEYQNLLKERIYKDINGGMLIRNTFDYNNIEYYYILFN